MVKNRIIIVAAGTGNRFGGAVPKQFALLEGRPVLMHTIDAFKNFADSSDIILVLSATETGRWETMCHEFDYKSPKVVTGGATRTDSVRNALAAIPEEENNADVLVYIHDGARPLVKPEMLSRLRDVFSDPDIQALVPCTPLTDSLMTNEPDDASAVDRLQFVAVQTPQVFRASTILAAYKAMPAGDSLSDDASVVKKYAGAKVHLIPGDTRNIKITYSTDLRIAEFYMSEQA